METKYVYLEELDSVRTSERDKENAERALYRALVFQGKKIAMSYNQIVDSVIFYELMEEKNVEQAILNFFKAGRIAINQYKEEGNISQYVQTRFSNKKFVSSYLEFLKLYDAETKGKIYQLLLLCLQYDNPDFFEKELIKISTLRESDRQKIINFAKFILRVNRYAYEEGLYITSDQQDGCKYSSLREVLDAIELCLDDQSKVKAAWRRLTDYMNTTHKDSRSECYYFIENHLNSSAEVAGKVKELVDLAYNIKVSDSIPLCAKLEDDMIAVHRVLNNDLQEDSLLDRAFDLKWEDGFRVANIASKLMEKDSGLEWEQALKKVPIKEAGEIFVSIGSTVVLAVILYFVGAIEDLWHNNILNGVISVVISLVFNAGVKVVEDGVRSNLPDWTNVKWREQLRRIMEDYRIVRVSEGKKGDNVWIRLLQVLQNIFA